ncbi:MerR family transcriptional regulator [Spirochaeta cellobiosiphila]|uniref:helix-turn-helix domain-containing protein n=1 Tax=Spirochaeta cellobiosiphila TaxID=504483 RepID=UPI0003FDDE45|nr:MerR family transcriptional regulator [Spirochaeta cellobiosiphila]
MNRQEFSLIIGISPEALRFYEKEGLLKPKRNPSNGYRVYDEGDHLRIDMILRFKRFGFTLNEIKTFFNYLDRTPKEDQEFKLFLRQKINHLEKQREDILTMKNALESFLTREDKPSCEVFGKIINRS